MAQIHAMIFLAWFKNSKAVIWGFFPLWEFWLQQVGPGNGKDLSDFVYYYQWEGHEWDESEMAGSTAPNGPRGSSPALSSTPNPGCTAHCPLCLLTPKCLWGWRGAALHHHHHSIASPQPSTNLCHFRVPPAVVKTPKGGKNPKLLLLNF